MDSLQLSMAAIEANEKKLIEEIQRNIEGKVADSATIKSNVVVESGAEISENSGSRRASNNQGRI